MADVASQIILHPTASASLKILGTTLGRDKVRSLCPSPPLLALSNGPQVYRATQYFARFFAWYLISRGHKVDAVRWNALKGHLAIARKRTSPFESLGRFTIALTFLFSSAPREADGTPAVCPPCCTNHG